MMKVTARIWLVGLLVSAIALTAAPAIAGPNERQTPGLSAKNRMLGWRGTKFQFVSVPGPDQCQPDTCDTYTFSVTSAPRSRLEVRIRWRSPSNDFDLYLSSGGQSLASSTGRGTTSELISLRHPQSGTYSALVVPVFVDDRGKLAPDMGYGGTGLLNIPARAPQTPVYRAPASIAADCSRDVTPDLLAWIASVPDNSTLSFHRNGCYRIDEALRLNDRWGLTFRGNRATFKAMTPGDLERRHFWFFGGGGLLIQNLTIVGANPDGGLDDGAWNPAYAFQHAIALQGVDGAVIDNVDASDLYGDFVYIAPDVRTWPFEWSHHVVVQNCNFERNGRQGFGIGAVSDLTIRWNYLGDVRHATFDMEPTGSSWGVTDATIVDNMTGRGRLLWLADAGQGFNVANINVVGNTMLYITGTPVIDVAPPDGGVRGPFTITRNDMLVDGSPRAAFEFHSATGVRVHDNTLTFPANRQMTAVALFSADTVGVTWNAFTGAADVLSADDQSHDFHEANNTT